jgi:hypothetical protein
MEKVKELMDTLGVLPKLRLGIKLQGGGVRSTGPHLVRFLSEPEGVTKSNHEGKPTKYLRFEVESGGVRQHWYVAVLNREGQPNYLLEKLVTIKPGDQRVLEMLKQGAKNYIDVRETDAPSVAPDDDEGELDDVYEENDAPAIE